MRFMPQELNFPGSELLILFCYLFVNVPWKNFKLLNIGNVVSENANQIPLSVFISYALLEYNHVHLLIHYFSHRSNIVAKPKIILTIFTIWAIIGTFAFKKQYPKLSGTF